MQTHLTYCLRGLLVTLGLVGWAAAAEPKITVLLEGLDNPSGIAIQPETNAVFVSDSGAGRVIRVADGKAQDVIKGFSLDVYGKGPMYNIGPLGLAFKSKDTLVVGDGSKPDGEELLLVYDLPADGSALNADQAKASFNLPATEEIKGEGNFYGVVVTANGIFVTCNGDDTKGWVSKCDIKEDGSFGPFARFIATKEAVQVDAPVAITVDNRKHLVVGQMGEINVPNDSLLSFYNSATGELAANFTTGLHDITALAYHPKTGKLYALDFAWSDLSQGGLFELVSKPDDNTSSTAKKIAPLMKPTAMVFDAEGALYVTVMGEAEEGSEAKPGKLLKIEL